MAKSPGKDGGAVTVITTPAVEAADPGMVDEEDLSLEEILTLYSQPINEEQAWAVCYQCCQSLVRFKHRRRSEKKQLNVGEMSGVSVARRIGGSEDVRIHKDGTVTIHASNEPGKIKPNQTTLLLKAPTSSRLLHCSICLPSSNRSNNTPR